MRMKLNGSVATLLLAAVVACAMASPLVPQVGDTYEITLTKNSAHQSTRGSIGSSDDNDAIVERVIGVHSDGLELEYYLPDNATADEKADDWQLPARIFKALNGPTKLLNEPELEARLEAWLKAAGLPRTLCGHWYFTWNAFQIECDPQSVLKTIESFDLRSADIREGISYRDTDAAGPGTITKKREVPYGATFAVEMPVDPNAVIRARAETDVAAGEILKRPVTLETALRERAKETISGSISIVFETDSAGTVWRRTKTTKLEIKDPDGQSETDTTTETLERRRISRRG